MKRIIFCALALSLVVLTLPSQVNGRVHRPAQIPNGTVNNSQNCHMSVFGRDARNPFGQTVEADFLIARNFAGNVLWGPELAAIDSDGDGFTNGEELGDPEGTWVEGDPESYPPEPTAVEESTWASVKSVISKLLR